MDKIKFYCVFANMMAKKCVDGDEHFYGNTCSTQYMRDMIDAALELNCLTLDTLDFLFGEMGGVEINDGFIMEV